MRRPKRRRKISSATYGKNWWPESRKFYNVLQSESMRIGINRMDIQCVFFSQTDPKLWTTKPIWSRPRYRYWLEHVLIMLRIIERMRQADSREEFLKKFGIKPHEPTLLCDVSMKRERHFPNIAKRFDKDLPKSYYEQPKMEPYKTDDAGYKGSSATGMDQGNPESDGTEARTD